MKKMGVVLGVIFTLFSRELMAVGPPYWGKRNDYAGSKLVMNRTGRPVYFTFYPQQLDPYQRFSQTFTYYLEPGVQMRCNYPGKIINAFTWRYDGPSLLASFYYANSEKVTNAISIVLKPGGQVDVV